MYNTYPCENRARCCCCGLLQGTNATKTEIPYSIFAHGIVGATPGVTPSDSELFVLNLAAELLLATKSTSILSEEIPPFGGKGAPRTVIELLLRCQQVVQEVIGVGQHGLMRMQSGDWSDLIMSRVGITYNSARYKHAVQVAESSLNAAMASRVFARWADALKMAQHVPSSNKLPPAAVLARAEAAAMKFATSQRNSLQRYAWNGSWFSRAWVDEQEGWVGSSDDRLMLEPQSWAMLGEAVARGSAEEAALIESILTLGNTPIGHSVYSKPYPAKPLPGHHPGSGAANAWPAINHPLVIALARSSKPEEAMSEWMKNSLASQAHYRPDFWAGIWSGADYTATPIEAIGGLTGWPEFPTWCTHRHAQPLWSIATGLAGVEFTSQGVTLRPAVHYREGGWEFQSRQLAVSRDADGTTFRGWVQPPEDDSPCVLRLALHRSVVAIADAVDVARNGSQRVERRGRARMTTWTSTSNSVEALVLYPEAQNQQKHNDTSARWVEVEPERIARADSGTRGDEDTYLLHDEAACGGAVRLHFVLQVY